MSAKSKKSKSIVPSSQQIITLDPSYIAKAKDWEDFVSLWMISREIDIRNQWFKGDIANRLGIVYGEGSLKKFAQEVQESTRIIEHYRRAARAYPENKRYLNLSWTHYLLASFADSYKKKLGQFDGNERFKWIIKAHDNKWSTTRLNEELKKAGVIADTRSIFEYYETYLEKVRNILLHIEKNKLTDEEKGKLSQKLADIYGEFTIYLKD